MEDTQKDYKLQEFCGFTAVYDVNEEYITKLRPDEDDEDTHILLPTCWSLPQTTPPPKKQATLFEKIVALFVKKEVPVNIVIVDMETDEWVWKQNSYIFFL